MRASFEVPKDGGGDTVDARLHNVAIDSKYQATMTLILWALFLCLCKVFFLGQEKIVFFLCRLFLFEMWTLESME